MSTFCTHLVILQYIEDLLSPIPSYLASMITCSPQITIKLWQRMHATSKHTVEKKEWNEKKVEKSFDSTVSLQRTENGQGCKTSRKVPRSKEVELNSKETRPREGG